ncbi:hypothetical protein BDB00DRAFT_848031 [Zychaea mexicana]|uniref:uncharacterized protein n=1 Tax=Zychaea mexicana TaxID=64656 RepID=UPI0022FE980B|nr:uncharacterized protein BDB00DRAFT_848031 [Zychaea mexicana]KAI9488429.1 hypothetical protein BDB00DRAFT_848031 [Zychaea mexicana]
MSILESLSSSSPHVIVQTTPGKGREFIAKESLPSGTTLFHVYPYATAIFDSFKKRICARCVCVHPTRYFSTHCHGCDQVYFCSQVCYEQYCPGRHTGQWICSALRKLATLKKVDRHEKSVAKLVLLIYWQREQEQQTIINDNNDNTPFLSTFEQVEALESHYNDWDESVRHDWHRIQLFLESQLVDKYTDTSDIAHLISKIESNGFGIYLSATSDDSVSSNKDKKHKSSSSSSNSNSGPVARALFPLVSLFNHDCNNNCEAEQFAEQQQDLESELLLLLTEKEKEGSDDSSSCGNDDEISHYYYYYPDVFSQTRGTFRTMVIRTIRHVNAGDPLTISYIDSSLPVSTRRQLLRQDYYFDCQCNRCIKELSSQKKKKKK